ncbi:MAG: ABC transporter ATP-binding protein [Rhodobacter sp.]|nr:ABC transporter ATP-binding protein [Rhodobacter sp.]
MATASFAVQVRNLVREFDGRRVLDGIDLDIRPGEFVAMLGRSGSGKSTCLRILAGLDTDARGTIRAAARRAVVFQDARLIPWKRVIQNVLLGLESAEARERAPAVLAEVGLADRALAWPLTLSGGEAQRVALARALVRAPELILLDEPFGALDALTRIKMHVLLHDLCARYRPAVLFVTHDVDEAILLADRIIVLTDGRISLDLAGPAPEDRTRGAGPAIALRRRLLQELGVGDAVEMDLA